MDLTDAFEKVALALGLGLLVGLQREHVQSPLAGIRTFALIAGFGAVCGLLTPDVGGWIVGAGAVSVAALLVAGNLAQPEAKRADPGLTTEIAALVMFAVGAYLVVGHSAVAIALGGVVALLLHWKEPLHGFVTRIGEDDLAAIMQFVLLTLVILPVLPDQTYGPYDVLNPRRIWLMVVLIVGIGLSGYVAHKWLGAKGGTVLSGVLGGLISSTATTASYARRAGDAPASARLAAIVLMIATTVSLARVLAEVAVAAPGSFPALVPPLALLLAWMAAIAAAMWFLTRGEDKLLPAQANPAELKSALIFGGLFALVLLGVAAARDWLGDAGLYALALLSGTVDLDAITLSTAQMVEEGRVEPGTGWRLILVAILSNLAMKGGIVALLGSRALLHRVALLFGAAGAGGMLLFAGAALLGL